MKTKIKKDPFWPVLIGWIVIGLTVSQCSSDGAEPSRPVVNVNTAPAQQIEFLPGIGEVIAARIVAARRSDDFTALEHLLYVKGIGEKRLAAIAPFVVFDGVSTATEKIKVSVN